MGGEAVIRESGGMTFTGVGQATFAENGVANSSGVVGKAISTGREDSLKCRGLMPSALSKSFHTSPFT